MAYDIGDVVRYSVAFTNAAGVATDPTSVTFRLRVTRAGTAANGTYTAGASSGAITIVKDGTGNYHADVAIAASGSHYWRWEGTGAITATAQGILSDVVGSYF